MRTRFWMALAAAMLAAPQMAAAQTSPAPRITRRIKKQPRVTPAGLLDEDGA